MPASLLALGALDKCSMIKEQRKQIKTNEKRFPQKSHECALS